MNLYIHISIDKTFYKIEQFSQSFTKKLLFWLPDVALPVNYLNLFTGS